MDKVREDRLSRWTAWKAEPQEYEDLLSEIAAGKSLNAWVGEQGFAMSTVYDWIDADEQRAAKYARARELQGEWHAQRILLEAEREPERLPSGAVDSGWVADKRLRVDTLKWIASKLAPKRYGDKLAIGGDEDAPAVRVDVNLSPAEAYQRMLGK